jgi:ABC-type nickel/cobalt efflux system permease component RcnA
MVIAVILVVLPWLILLLIPANAPTDVRNVLVGVSTILIVASGLYILFLTLYKVLRIAFKK